MPTTKNKKTASFSDVEREAMKARAKELAAEARSSKNKAKGESDVLAAIAAMPAADGTMAKRLHALIKKNAPELWPKTWYGMPAYAKDNKVVCFFQSAGKFDSRYSTLGFSDQANLDQGNIWPTTFGLKKLTTTEEAKIIELVKKAIS